MFGKLEGSRVESRSTAEAWSYKRIDTDSRQQTAVEAEHHGSWGNTAKTWCGVQGHYKGDGKIMFLDETRLDRRGYDSMAGSPDCHSIAFLTEPSVTHLHCTPSCPSEIQGFFTEL
ncbi:hypothetical protein RRG08_058767 [Elysia crispata]|uniref:Uncharacterized protein n=1 Tax=Elysia crispata TaxID=231223 RepID=A0AAE0YWT7_9GAST|nr:hypothetical protein RRG08_058767 [Elysia crispata]